MSESERVLTLFDVAAPAETGFAVFEKEVRSQFCHRCKKWRSDIDYSRTRLEIVPQLRRLPDFFPEWVGHSIVRQDICNILLQEKITGFVAYPAEWARVQEWVALGDGRRIDRPLPTYFHLEPTGRVDLDLYELDHGQGYVCSECHSFNSIAKKPYRWSPIRRLPILETWDGSDFATWRNAPGPVLCTRKVVDIVVKYQWTGMRFGHLVPGVAFSSPIAPNWLEEITSKVRAKHPDLFQEHPSA